MRRLANSTGNTISKYGKHVAQYYKNVESGKTIVSKDIEKLLAYLPMRLEGAIIDTAAMDITIDKIGRYFPFELIELQKFILSLAVGVRDKDGLLMFSDIFCYMGRGSGKNGLISALAFDRISDMDIKNYDVHIVATSEEQAKTSFQDVYHVIGDNPRLSHAFFKTKEQIRYLGSNSVLKFKTSNARTADGGRPGMVIFDEVHAYESYDLIKVHTSGLGKVPDARTVYITTDGNNRGGVLDDLLEEATATLNGEIKDSRMLPVLCRLDDKKEVENPDMWQKAVPLINHWAPLKNEMKKAYVKANLSPQLMVEFMTKRMNCPTEHAASCVTSWENILATNREIPDLSGAVCVGGLDYAEINDFAAVGKLYKLGNVRIWRQHTFVCAQTLTTGRYKFDVHEAEAEGLCTIVHDDIIRPELLVDWFLTDNEYADILTGVACDMYRERLVTKEFERAGIPLQIVRAGARTHNMIAPVIDEMFATKSIIYGDDKLMRWYTNNVKVTLDAKGNKTYSKIDAEKRKTDGFMAFIHAMTLETTLDENNAPPVMLPAYVI